MELGLSTLPHDPFQVLADDIILQCDWKQYRQRNTIADYAFTLNIAFMPLLILIWLPCFFPLWLFKRKNKNKNTKKQSKSKGAGILT